jgi:2-C-methyl-D-erythritol 4-phosphate cytidylyltransferase
METGNRQASFDSIVSSSIVSHGTTTNIARKIDPVKPFALIVPAAGSGSRSGSSMPKQYVPLLGVPMLRHTLERFHRFAACLEIVVAIDAEFRSEAEQCVEGLDRVMLTEGGTERQHSIANAIARLRSHASIVLVHDAARPCVSHQLIERVVQAAAEHGAVLPVMPINDTVKQVDEQGRVVQTIPRGELRTAQTPQGFERDLLKKAYAHAAEHGIAATDDASLVEALGEDVWTVDGEAENIKITLPTDFVRAEELLASTRDIRSDS